MNYFLIFLAMLLDMTRSNANLKRQHSDLPQFESVARISSFPIVESGIHIAGSVYDMIKVSLMNLFKINAVQNLET